MSKTKKQNITLDKIIPADVKPPSAPEIEASVLGAMLIEKEAVPKAIELLSSESFYLKEHKLIFEAMISLFDSGEPIDTVTLYEELKKRQQLEEAGGAVYLSKLSQNISSAANIEYHAKIILEKEILRGLITSSHEIARSAYEGTEDAFDILDEAERKIFEITETHLKKSFLGMDRAVRDALEYIEAIHSNTKQKFSVPTGFYELDEMLGGFQKSDLIIIAARPSMGKCLGKGTRVLLYDGSVKAVEDVEVGDMLMGDDSTPRRVLSLARGREMMYWVRQLHGIDYRVNESHILSLKRSRNQITFAKGEVVNIEVKDYLKQSDKWKNNFKGYKAAVDFSYSDVPLDPYLFGLWLGDGKSDSSRIFSQDAEVIDYMESYAANYGQTVSVYHDKDKCPAYTITGGRSQKARDNPVQAILREMGVLNNKHIPNNYIANSKSIRLQLLAGLIDSDGFVNSGYGDTVELTSKYEHLARQVKFLCDTLGYRTSLKTKTAKISAIGFESTVWRVLFNGNIDEIPTRVKRKQCKTWTDFRDWKVTGIRIEPDRVDEYYGFEIDGNKLFLLEDCTVTHNTAFALSLARNAGVDHKVPVGIFSLEMSTMQLVIRMLCAEGRLNAHLVRTGKLPHEEGVKLSKNAHKLIESPIFVDDMPAQSVLEIRAKARRLKAEHNIGLIIIDYLQLMQGPANSESREREISHISRSLKSLAKELNIPVIALAQLNRAVETRTDKRPQLSDLRESGCLAGDTLILNHETGERIEIQELAKQKNQLPIKVLAMDNDLHISGHNMVKAFHSGKKEVFELKTKSGRVIKASANHPFYKLNGWARLDKLKPGDKIAVARRLDISISRNSLRDEELILLAHLTGDGCILEKQPYHYTSADKSNIDTVKSAAKKLFDINGKVVKQKNWYHLYLTSPYHLSHSTMHPITLWFENLGLERVRSYEKKLPQSLFMIDSSKISLFLMHLWATDGNISWIKPSGNRKQSLAVYYSTSSSILSEQVQHLLLRVGIRSTIKAVKNNKGYRQMYHVIVSGSSNQLNFLERIGCAGERGKEISKMINTLEEISSNPNDDVIPSEAWYDVIRECKNEAGISWRKFANGINMSYCGSSLFKNGISRSRMTNIYRVLPFAIIKNLSESDIYWDEIQSITALGIQNVFDATVEGVHNFMANDFIVHNSIEQDADVVLFLNRPEYYGFKTFPEDGSSTEGIAEIIIGKQRNGPTGEVRMAFIKEYARFENLAHARQIEEYSSLPGNEDII